MMMLVGMLLLSVTRSTQAATPYTGPESGSVGLSGKVTAPPPTKPAVIINPKVGQRFSSSPITVSGTCPQGTLVEIFKNDIFAGSAGCDKQTFSLQIDLLYGANVLLAKVYDDLGQAGPDSNLVTVYYDASPKTVPANAPTALFPQLLLRSDGVYRGVFPSNTLKVNLEIFGGLSPYAVSIDWGDGRNDLKSQSGPGRLEVDHVYNKPGSYNIIFHASDGAGNSAFLQVIAVVNGQPSAAATFNPLSGRLGLAWPIFIALLLMVISFWLGEKYKAHGLLRAPGLSSGLPEGF